MMFVHQPQWYLFTKKYSHVIREKLSPEEME